MNAEQEQTRTSELATHAFAEDAGRVTADKIVSAVKQIVAKAHPLQVIAFGSRARGHHRPDSDLDLAVVVERYDSKKDQRPVSRVDVDAWMSIDILVMTRERLEFMKDSIMSVQRDIWDEGVTLYDAGNGFIDQSAAERLAR